MNILVSVYPFNADLLGIIKINYTDAINGYDVDKITIDQECALIYETLFNYIATDAIHGDGTSLTEMIYLLMAKYSESRILAECLSDDLMTSRSYKAAYTKITKVVSGLPLHPIRFHKVSVSTNKKNIIIELT